LSTCSESIDPLEVRQKVVKHVCSLVHFTYCVDRERWSVGHLDIIWFIGWCIDHESVEVGKCVVELDRQRQESGVSVAATVVSWAWRGWTRTIELIVPIAVASVCNCSSLGAEDGFPGAVEVGIELLSLVVGVEVPALVVGVRVAVAVAIVVLAVVVVVLVLAVVVVIAITIVVVRPSVVVSAVVVAIAIAIAIVVLAVVVVIVLAYVDVFIRAGVLEHAVGVVAVAIVIEVSSASVLERPGPRGCSR